MLYPLCLICELLSKGLYKSLESKFTFTPAGKKGPEIMSFLKFWAVVFPKREPCKLVGTEVAAGVRNLEVRQRHLVEELVVAESSTTLAGFLPSRRVVRHGIVISEFCL